MISPRSGALLVILSPWAKLKDGVPISLPPTTSLPCWDHTRGSFTLCKVGGSHHSSQKPQKVQMQVAAGTCPSSSTPQRLCVVRVPSSVGPGTAVPVAHCLRLPLLKDSGDSSKIENLGSFARLFARTRGW